jgi:hypothetical protein
VFVDGILTDSLLSARWTELGAQNHDASRVTAKRATSASDLFALALYEMHRSQVDTTETMTMT